MGWFIGGAILLAVLFGAFALVRRRRTMWRGRAPHAVPLVYIDTAMAVSPTVLGHPMPDGYRLASLYFGAGLIDRTETLDHGFPYRIFDPIPKLGPAPATFADLCAERAGDLVAEARATNRKLHLLWSGGIDSTTACCALLDALGSETDRLVIFMNAASRAEYPAFYKTHLRALQTVKINTIDRAFAGDAIVVTGEHGDQLFGSAKALEFDISDVRKPWQTALPVLLAERLASAERADAIVDYLTPQLARAPVPLADLFTCLWWMNYSMKWQAVSLRMLPGWRRGTYDRYQERVAHFFQTVPFELWALNHAGQGVGATWQTYKWPARDVIGAFTRDTRYAATKEKVPSLKGLVARRFSKAALAIDADGGQYWQEWDQSLRKRRQEDGSGGGSGGYSSKREDPLWDDMNDGE
ncbi:MAG: hypothetical protein AAFQ45_12395 [Pseudomonadota bacterium]